METENRRVYSRTNHVMPIVFTDLKTQKIYNATLVNHSKGGFFFESDHALSPGKTVSLKKESNPADHVEAEFPTCHAEVIWCRKTEISDTETGYDVGLQCVEYECMVCNKIIKSDDFQATSDGCCICPDCASSYDSISDSAAKKSIKNILIGNVL